MKMELTQEENVTESNQEGNEVILNKEYYRLNWEKVNSLKQLRFIVRLILKNCGDPLFENVEDEVKHLFDKIHEGE